MDKRQPPTPLGGVCQRREISGGVGFASADPLPARPSIYAVYTQQRQIVY